jgi:ABC-type dipeptide/oligopeptide/nickel transport system permease subunit
VFGKQQTQNISPGRIAWLKFRNNAVAMTALIWILLNILLATAGYLITPDKAPFANSQHLELSAIHPGSKVVFLHVRKNHEVVKRNFFQKMLYGRENPFHEIPVSHYRIEEDEVVVGKYTGFDDFEGMEFRYSLADVIFSIDSAYREGAQVKVFPRKDDPFQISISDLQNMVVERHIATQTFWLGTDRFGRDMLSQTIIGARISLSVGFIAIIIALVLGILMGSLAGFYRGRIDNFVVWFINVVWSVPTLLLVIAITFALGKGFWQIFIAVGLTMWVDVARVVRGQIISLRENEYIEAARALGLPGLRIIRRHLLPNIMGPVVVISAANFASAILIEAGLSFLGIGVQPPMPSWGNMIRENYGFIILDKAFLAMIPGICIMLLVMAFMLVGNGLRDALDKSPVNY